MTTNESLAQASNLLVYSAMVTYTCAFVAFAADLASMSRPAKAEAPKKVAEPAALATAGARSGGGADVVDSGTFDGAAVAGKRRPMLGSAIALTILSALLHTGSVVARGWSVHRVPWGNMYEFALTGSLLVTLIYCLVLWKPSLAAVPRGHDLRWLGTFITGPVLLTLGLAVAVLYTEAAQLVPALNEKFWLAIHVFIATASSALFTVAFSVTVIQLVQERREQRAQTAQGELKRNFMDHLPSSVGLEAIAHRINAIAFPLWTFTIVAGAIWAEKAWGRYWNWDPKETWSFVTFVVYAAYLHARATGGWNRRAAWLAMAAFACLLANFGIVNVFFKGLHSYAGIG